MEDYKPFVQFVADYPKYLYWNIIGSALAVFGAISSIIGTIENNILLDHHTAMLLWAISNPVLFLWTMGVIKGKWHDGISMEALAVMYAFFFVTGIYGLFIYV